MNEISPRRGDGFTYDRTRSGSLVLNRRDPRPTRKVEGAGAAGGIGAAAAALVTALLTGGDVEATAQVFGAALSTAAVAFVVGYFTRDRA